MGRVGEMKKREEEGSSREEKGVRNTVSLNLHGPRKWDTELLFSSLSGVTMETEHWSLHD